MRYFSGDDVLFFSIPLKSTIDFLLFSCEQKDCFRDRLAMAANTSYPAWTL